MDLERKRDEAIGSLANGSHGVRQAVLGHMDSEIAKTGKRLRIFSGRRTGTCNGSPATPSSLTNRPRATKWGALTSMILEGRSPRSDRWWALERPVRGVGAQGAVRVPGWLPVLLPAMRVLPWWWVP